MIGESKLWIRMGLREVQGDRGPGERRVALERRGGRVCVEHQELCSHAGTLGPAWEGR